jgi:hypothetical protein
MSAALRIDTLKFVRKLTEAGMERPMAEAIAEGLAETDTSELATKADLGILKADLAAVGAELKADIQAVRFEAAENKAEIFRFMMLQAVAIVGLTVTLIKLLP